MILIIDSTTKKVLDNMGTNSAFPDGNILNLPELPEGKEYIRVHDASEIAHSINLSHAYDLVLDEDGKPVSINVTKTKEDYRKEHPPEPVEDPVIKRFNALEKRIEALEKRGVI
jgi:hypothetical protein